MSSAATDPTCVPFDASYASHTHPPHSTAENNGVAASDASADKGKGKVVSKDDNAMEEDDEDDDEEEDDDDDEDESSEEDEEESFNDIDPSVIQPRRTRGVKVDYTSAEALAKAGMTAEEASADDDDTDVKMKDD
ncbi:histone H2A.Z-specific chaperone CHZ1 [Mycena filopes]|nr:histone H2A.Z-specific chaperone CHZ1 [Mycena filopes]